LAEEIIPPGGTTPETPPAAPDNAAFARLRTEAAASKEALAAAQAKLTEIERSQLAEVDRLKLVVADGEKKLAELEPLRDENGKFRSAVEKACADAIATLPEDKRAAVAELVAFVPLDQRLGVINKQMALLGTPPMRGGTVTQPATPQPGAQSGTPPEPTKPRTVADVRKESWGDAYKARGVAPGPPDRLAEKAQQREAAQE
jgi:hypothetical protein